MTNKVIKGRRIEYKKATVGYHLMKRSPASNFSKVLKAVVFQGFREFFRDKAGVGVVGILEIRTLETPQKTCSSPQGLGGGGGGGVKVVKTGLLTPKRSIGGHANYVQQ